ncbi:chondroadherin-like isoform X1 [Mytilus californianus]|uniref:chondroadherin-like isoform X1 n=1 Tax=Mytilus californianus TaxID=6549 RepID=UPI002245C75A|nr:chondroadherin-like isoform X1 [Mytilus californianus]
MQTACANPCIELSCVCQGTEVKCNQKKLVNIPDGIPTTTKTLDVQQNKISTIAEDTFSKLTSLEMLHLGFNQISTCTADMFNGLVSLKVLVLSYNQISIIAADTFKDLLSLTTLVLDNNKISTIASDMFKDIMSLDVLGLSNNQISIITADTFKGLMSLGTLILSRNQISTIAKNAFKDLISLKYLYLDYNEISTIARDTFKGLVSLTYITLTGNDFTSISPNIFRKITNITRLYLGYNSICCNMTDLFKWKASQTELNEFVGNCLDFDALTEISDFNISNCTIQVDGQWGSWSTTLCSVTCGSGTKYRNRICNNPLPSDEGKYCVGNDTEISQCNLGDCSVDGQWGSWSTTLCSVTCGSGTEYRNRICNNPSPSDEGKYCVGNDTEISQCNLGDCSVLCKHGKRTHKKSDKRLQKTRTWLGIFISDLDLTHTHK